MKRSSCDAILGIALLITLILCPPALAELTFHGDLESNTDYVTTDDDSTDTSTTEYASGGRIKFTPTARTESGNLFFEVTAQFLAQIDGDVNTDDVYGKVGTSTFDFQIGRWEAWDLFAKNDIYIASAPNGCDRYETNYARGRMAGPGQLALHVTPNDTFALEVAAVYGAEGSDNYAGLRPVVDLKFGMVEFLAGFDYLTISPQNDDSEDDATKAGYGARVQATFGIASLYINYGHGVVSEKIAGVDQPDETTTSYGANVVLALGPGSLTLAGIMTTQEIEDSDYDCSHNQYYISYAHPLPIDGAAIKFAYSMADATQESAAGDLDGSASGFRVRITYDF